MDTVYVNRDGENLELRYSLRSLQNVPHGQVWIFGGVPEWVNTDLVNHVSRSQTGSPYASTRGHILAACKNPQVSDPFMLWNDDFFAMKPVDRLEPFHRGEAEALFLHLEHMKTTWVKGLRETVTLLSKGGLLETALSYDLHVPMTIHKEPMLEALEWAKKSRADAVHLRTLYGALAKPGGELLTDPKVVRKSDPFPQGPWMSSSPDTFRSAVGPVLRYLFPLPSPYETTRP